MRACVRACVRVCVSECLGGGCQRERERDHATVKCALAEIKGLCDDCKTLKYCVTDKVQKRAARPAPLDY